MENMVVPGKTQLGEPIEVKTIINSNISTNATVRLFRNGIYITSKETNLTPGKNLVSFIDERKEAGIARYETLVEPGKDTFSENNVAHGYTVVSGEPRILLVSGEPSESRPLVSALQSENIRTDLRNSRSVPFNMADLANYDVLIFDDVSALSVDNTQMKLIQSYVKDMGGGIAALIPLLFATRR